VSVHIKGTSHTDSLKKSEEDIKKKKSLDKIVQGSLVSFLANPTIASRVPVVLDPSLESFRINTISACLKAGIDTEKIAKISTQLSSPQYYIPGSSSSIRTYIPIILRHERESIKSLLKDRYLFINFLLLMMSYW
jgi:hypothetical protein